MDQFLEEVTMVTRRLAGPGKRRDGGGQIYRFKLPVPRVRAALKSGYSFSGATRTELIRIWDHIWRTSNCYEVMSQALYFYQGKSLSRTEVSKIRHWVERCDCWEHSDDLSKIYAQVVEEQPDLMLPTLRKWNGSTNPWKRRQSVVGLIEYSRKRRRFRPFGELISFVQALLDDDEYYVQKGVGWTLREIFNAYPEKTKQFIEDNALAIHPLAWSAATEKLDKALKAKLNASRRASRSALK